MSFEWISNPVSLVDTISVPREVHVTNMALKESSGNVAESETEMLENKNGSISSRSF